MTKNDAVPPLPDGAPARCAGPHCQEALPTREGTRRGRNPRYCSTRCRTAAYRTRKEPSRRTHQEQILAGVERLRSLPPVGDLSCLDQADVKNLAGLVERALAMHEAIDAALRKTTPLSPAPQPRAAQTEAPAGPAQPAPAAQQTPDPGRASGPAALVPRRLADGSWAPTPEQEAIVHSALQGENLAVIAGAGTGKTETLSLVGTALKGKRGLYIAFNRAIADEAATRMPSNVSATTTHALAFRALGHRYRGRLHARRLLPAQVAEALGITEPLAVTERVILAPAALATQVMEMVRRFCYSAHRTLRPEHLPPLAGLERAEHHRLAEHLLPLARTAWRDLKKPDGQGGVLKLTHDHYLKMWALSDPQLDFDFIALDEAQDTNPAVAALVRDQHTQQIVVGDSAQQVYGWRGARDALETWPVQRRLLLSQSWRFGQRIAERANECLHMLGMELRLVGNPARESTVGALEGPDVVLCRTNATAMSRAMQEMAQGRRTALLGAAEGIRALAQAAGELQAGRSASHPELSAFTNWHQVREYVEQAPEEAAELSALVRLVDSHGPHTIISATHRMDTEDNAQVVCGTAHKAKGRQWATVEVADDFREPQPAKDGTPGTASRAEVMLAYVTLTRAQYRLDPAGLEWIHARATGAPSPRPAKTRPDRERAAPPGTTPQPSPTPTPTPEVVVAAQPALDLAGSYLADLPGQGEVTITTKVKRRKQHTTISGLHPLLADKLAALSDYERPHVEMLLHGALIAIYDETNGAPDSFLVVTRDRGRLCTTYQGHPDLTTDEVLDLAERLRAQLTGTAPPQPRPAPAPTPAEDVPWPHTSPAPTSTTRADLESDIARYLDQCGGAHDIDPVTVAAAVVDHYGLRTWESLDQDQVTHVLRL